ncbi:MAG: outer membrane protein transport protein [Pirellulales bacterium]|nr:outer membrane protein transport protein [Pirellulales bacterium]
MRQIRSTLAVFGILVLLTGTVLADGVTLNGVSPRAIGRGGTNIAHADNGAILYNNPAAAVNIEGTTLLDIGTDLVIGDYHFTNPRNNADADVNPLPLPQVALIRKSCDGRVACGFGIYVPAGFSEDYDMNGPPALPGRHHYKSFGSLMKFLPGVAFRVTDRLSIGATFGVAVTHDEIEGPYCLQGPSPLAGTPLMMDFQGTGATSCWSVGLQYELSDATTLGLTYESESFFRTSGSTHVDVPGLGDCRYDSELRITWPRSLGFGLRHELCPHRVVSMDVIWYNWSAAFDNLTFNLTNPNNPGFIPILERLPLHWQDSISVRLGYEHVLPNKHVLRCGYVNHRNPIPNGTITPYIQATAEHAVSLGYGWKWREWNIDFAYMFAFGQEQHVGASDLLGADFSNSVHRSQVHDISFSFIRHF